jgi:hypothetical protein
MVNFFRQSKSTEEIVYFKSCENLASKMTSKVTLIEEQPHPALDHPLSKHVVTLHYSFAKVCDVIRVKVCNSD